MKEMLVGLETEYGIRCDSIELARHFDINGGDLVFILKRVADLLPEGDYVVTSSCNGEFWTRSGMRIYPDRNTHIEVSTPECRTFEEMLFQKNVGEALLQALMDRTRSILLQAPYFYNGPLEVIANNTARHPVTIETPCPEDEATFARHENYLLRRDMFQRFLNTGTVFDHIFVHAGLFFAARPILGGSGHINRLGVFLLSPRSSFMFDTVGGNTTGSRSLVNNRDESHADSDIFLRYHHIAGDTNITDGIAEMKIAFTYWVLRLLERGWCSPSWFLMNRRMIMEMIKLINCDPDLKRVYQNGGKKFTALDVLDVYLEAVDKNRAAILFDDEDDAIFRRIVSYLERLKHGAEFVVGQSEWATKYMMLSADRERRGERSFDYHAARKFSIALHNIDPNPQSNPFAALRQRVLPKNMEVGDLVKACRTAPRTRAFIRGLSIYLAHKFGLVIHFPSGLEWASISVSILPAAISPKLIYLNRTTPWDLNKDDIVEVVVALRNLAAVRKDAAAQTQPSTPFYGV